MAVITVISGTSISVSQEGGKIRSLCLSLSPILSPHSLSLLFLSLSVSRFLLSSGFTAGTSRAGEPKLLRVWEQRRIKGTVEASSVFWGEGGSCDGSWWLSV